jgi:transcriptional regulator with XRE-family HTH domain
MDAEVGRRIRAARAYADLKQPELAEQLGVSRDTLYRLEKGGRQLRPLEDEHALLGRIGELCGLPLAFFTEPFEKLESALDDPLGHTFVRAGAKIIAGTGQVVFMPDHPLYDSWVATKPILEKIDRGEDLSDNELALAASTIEEIAAAAADQPGGGEVAERLERIESRLNEFADGWEEQGLPAAGLIQAHFGDADEEDEATTRTDRRSGRPAAGQ